MHRGSAVLNITYAWGWTFVGQMVLFIQRKNMRYMLMTLVCYIYVYIYIYTIIYTQWSQDIQDIS